MDGTCSTSHFLPSLLSGLPDDAFLVKCNKVLVAAELPGVADITSGSGGMHTGSQGQAARNIVLQAVQASVAYGTLKCMDIGLYIF